MGIETLATLLGQNLVHETEAIGARYFQGLPIPQKQMQVVSVEAIYVQGLTGSLTHITKTQLPQSADLTNDSRYLMLLGTVNLKFFVFDQPLVFRLQMYFITQSGR